MKQAFMLCGIALLLASCATGGSGLKQKQGDIYLSAGAEALQAGDYTQALGSLKEAVKLLPKSTEGWGNLGLAYAAKNEFPRAESCWKKALELDPTFTDARLNLGALYLQQKKFLPAEKELKLALKDLSYLRGAQVKYNLGLLYREQGKSLPALQYFKMAVAEDEIYCAAWFSLGEMQRDKGLLAEATNSFQKAVGGPCFRNPQAHFELGGLYLRARESAKAKAKLLEIIQFFPQSEWAQKAELTLNMIR